MIAIIVLWQQSVMNDEIENGYVKFIETRSQQKKRQTEKDVSVKDQRQGMSAGKKKKVRNKCRKKGEGVPKRGEWV